MFYSFFDLFVCLISKHFYRAIVPLVMLLNLTINLSMCTTWEPWFFCFFLKKKSSSFVLASPQTAERVGNWWFPLMIKWLVESESASDLNVLFFFLFLMSYFIKCYPHQRNYITCPDPEPINKSGGKKTREKEKCKKNKNKN